MMRIFPVMLIALLSLITPASPVPATAPEEGMTTITYTPSTPDGKAFYFKFEINEATECVRIKYRAEMDLGEPVPWWVERVTGVTLRIDDREVPLEVAGKTIFHGEGGSGYDQRSGDTGHFMLNASIGGIEGYRIYEEHGYDERAPNLGFSSISALCDLKTCRIVFTEAHPACTIIPDFQTAGFWLSVVMTPRVRNVSFEFDFYEDYDGPAFQGTHGNARGSMTFASDSNRTFIKQLKDFEGTFSYNGDPFGTELGPNAAGANLQTQINVERGMVGGFVDYAANPSLTFLSYDGPADIGASLETPMHFTPVREMAVFRGAPGEWTFRAHTHAAPHDYSALALLGADIELPTT